MTQLTRLSLRYPLISLVAVLLVTGGLGAGLTRLQTDVGYRAFLGTEHRSLQRFDAFLEHFGGGLSMAAVWSCDESPTCDSVFDRTALEMADDIARELRSSAAIRGVTSPANAVLLAPGPAGPLPRRLIEEGRVAADRGRLAELARSNPSWVGQLISADGRVAAIVVELEGSDSATSVDAFAALEAAIAPHAARGTRFHLVGGPVEFVVAGGELDDAMARVIPLMVALVGIVTCVLIRSVPAAIASLLSVGAAVVWTLGTMAWLGWPQNSLTQTLPPLVLVIGVCDAIHLVARYRSLLATQTPRDAAERDSLILSAASQVARPCLVTSLTTAAGFLSFAGAELASFSRFGIIAAFGVMAALLLSFSLLPLILRQLPLDIGRAQSSGASWQRMLERVVALPQARPVGVLVLASAIAAGGALGFARLRVDASFEELYGADSKVVRWASFVAEHLRRPDTLEVELLLPEGLALADPAALSVIESVEARLARISQLGPAHSLLGPLQWARRATGDAQEATGDAGGILEENAALLSLLRGSEAGEDGLAQWVDREQRRVRISVDAEKPPQDELRELMRRVNALLAEELPEGWTGSATGPLAVVHDMIEAIRTTQLESFAVAGLAVFTLVAVFFGSLRSAALALVPTLLPVIVTLGILGLAGISLDIGSAMVAAVILGVAVDDAVHLLEAYDALRRRGHDVASAVRDAVLSVGGALVTTSAALGLGFAALTLSPWQSVASFGLISAVAIGVALVSTLVVLPALLMLGQGARPAARDAATL